MLKLEITIGLFMIMNYTHSSLQQQQLQKIYQQNAKFPESDAHMALLEASAGAVSMNQRVQGTASCCFTHNDIVRSAKAAEENIYWDAWCMLQFYVLQLTGAPPVCKAGFSCRTNCDTLNAP